MYDLQQFGLNKEICPNILNQFTHVHNVLDKILGDTNI